MRKIILAIETTCDETAIAILKGKKILTHLLSSQIKIHQTFGGVVPQIASRLHLNNLPILLKKIITKSKIKLEDIDFITYSSHPGLINSLIIGKIAAETIASFLKIPLFPSNHLYSHFYSPLINKNISLDFPILGLIISGGHTELLLLDKNFKFKKLGSTLDDAVGECLDKVSVMLGYGYPGGMIIEKLAKKGKQFIFLIKHITQKKLALNFSFSGLKSAARRYIEQHKDEKGNFKNNFNIFNFAFSLQKIIKIILLEKIMLAQSIYKAKILFVGGGVSANDYLRKELLKLNKDDFKVFFPLKKFSTDNAVMVAINLYVSLKYFKN